MNAISFKKWVSTILLLAITISLCGCSTNRTAASQDEHLTTTTAFIVLNGANVPALNSSAIASFVDTPQDGDRSILIVPDGNPSIKTFSFDSTAKNVTYATAESKKWYKEICTSIIDARPDDADTDLLSAILLAANELKASDTQARHLMLLCNGLNTAPMLNFAETPFWSDATSIDEIISQLLKLNYLSADLLEDVDVTWALKPADFLQQCRDDNIAWRRVQDLINPPKQRKNSSLQAKAASAELQEQSERMTNIVVYSSQLFEIRKILIDLYLQAKIRMANGDAEQTTYEEQYDRIDRAYGNKLLSLDHNTSFKKGSNGWKEFLQWDKEIKDSMVAKFVALYPYEELAVIQNSKNDGISRRQQLNNRVKYAEACLQDSKWLLRDDFLRLAFLDYLVTEPPENSDKEKKDSMEIIRDFANREGPILERCRLKPYDPDKDALTQDFVRTLENK